ncbi:fimbria/pilus outer membrane usher protein [Klebsiella sp. K794]|nr:fimbria/pilus outer membrane usher protein [Klebsiella michiganensis]ARB20296.1 fimbrial assembly protein [Klebsiella oxytoca]MDI3169331.1 fimbria/pilus outer membrane usher protein [Klebsiella michiganensis]MDM4124789.1 fimbria/pilus outer membrane usher protein [Klebsiella michiganensis]MDM4161645.1 fimbria/pilus outer membrane usher protein [Klebsiella michiganensis]MDS7753574.1 fimbria/pilus outer membrane usher protein [Klebsiella michiganensis]
MKKSRPPAFYLRRLGIYIAIAILGSTSPVVAVEFNIDILDSEDRENIDLSRFSQAGYIMPGTYTLSMRLNEHGISDQEISFIERTRDDEVVVETCLTPAQVELLGLRDDALNMIKWLDEGRCADFSALEGVVLRGDLSESSLQIAVPQAWLEYQDASWLPVSRWEEGIPGMLVDYNLNTNVTWPRQGNQSQSASISGTTGVNLGAWRLRGDYQGSYYNTTGRADKNSRNFDWSRFYAYRALPGMMSKLTVGEDYLSSDLFDSWRYTGLSLASDESQLPPKLRGYAPEVSGIARTNAKVTVSQQGRVIYETTVAAGPFRIQELNSALTGRLDVRVEEQDGSVQKFAVETAQVPYLTRPGQLRYKMTTGRPRDYNHSTQGPYFATGELSWGLTNAWSLYGGGIFSQDYNSLALGAGRDMNAFGTLSADVTHASARFPDDKNRQGRSWRLSYSKRFDEINSEVTFAGYRFSERNYLTMGEYLDMRYREGYVGNSKELYTIQATKNFADLRLSTHINWSHQTYWNRPATDRYSVSLNKYFDLGDWRHLSLSLNAVRSEFNGRKDDSAYISLTMPFGSGTVGYNGSISRDRYTQNASWSQRLDNNDYYSINAGNSVGGGEGTRSQMSGYYSHLGNMADVTTNFNWAQSQYSSFGISASGGLTATAEGVALHPGGVQGGTRLMVSTDGVSGVPVGFQGHTNAFGIAVIPGVPNYYRTRAEIDVNRLPDDVESGGTPVVELALTEGAIGFRRFDVLKGSKVVAILSQEDGRHPPFGATVHNAKDRELGMVSDSGLAWLTGVNPDERLTVHWSGSAQCEVVLPRVIPAQQLLLPCKPVTRG